MEEIRNCLEQFKCNNLDQWELNPSSFLEVLDSFSQKPTKAPVQLLLYYLQKHERTKLLNALTEYTQSKGLIQANTLTESNDTATLAFTEAIELNLPDFALDILEASSPNIANSSLVLLLEKEYTTLLKCMLRKNHSEGETKGRLLSLFRFSPNTTMEPSSKFTLSTILETALKGDIAPSKLLNALMECKEFAQPDTLGILLKHGQGKVAKHLLGLNYPSSEDCLVSALETGAYKFALAYLYKTEFTLKDQVRDVTSTLIKRFEADWAHNEIHLFVISKLLTYFSHNEILLILTHLKTVLSSRQKLLQYLETFMNPFKLLALQLDLCSRMGKSSSLKAKCEIVMQEIAEIMKVFQENLNSDEEVRKTLLDKDIEGRTVIYILSDIGYVHIVQKHNLAILADDVWTGGCSAQISDIIPGTSSLWKLLTDKTEVETDVEATGRSELVFKRAKYAVLEHPLQFELWKKGVGYRYIVMSLEFLAIFIWIFAYSANLRSLIKSASEKAEYYYIPEVLKQVNEEFNMILKGIVQAHYLVIFIGVTWFRLIFRYIYRKLSGRNFAIFDGDFVISSLLFLDLIMLSILAMPEIGPQSWNMPEDLPTTLKIIAYIDPPSNFGTCIGVFIFLSALRFIECLRVSVFLGPFITMFKEMCKNLATFSIFFVLILLSFGFAGSIIIPWEVPGVKQLDTFILSLFQTSMGELDLLSENYKLPGLIFMISYIVLCNILLLNLIIAILNNVYTELNGKTDMLYLQEIISLRELYKPHNELQFLNWTFGPLDLVTSFIGLLFYPFLGKETKGALNSVILRIQYTFHLLVSIPFFLIAELVMLPLVYIRTLFAKFMYLIKGKERGCYRLWSFLEFLVIGVVILLVYLFSDLYYYVKNSYIHKLPAETTGQKVPIKSLKEVVKCLEELPEETDLENAIKEIQKIFNFSPLKLLSRGELLTTNPNTTGTRKRSLQEYAVVAGFIRAHKYNKEDKQKVNTRKLAEAFKSYIVTCEYRTCLKSMGKVETKEPVKCSQVIDSNTSLVSSFQASNKDKSVLLQRIEYYDKARNVKAISCIEDEEKEDKVVNELREIRKILASMKGSQFK
eukprot:TRINITY_DN2554_c0_g2_i1.p1 TRINITY_DN2554_c0_g2~~TRINITY_DN2554_c0_g2_i1.p1  ORF type:complete len:1085 (+),score=110.67 TRINITY_DN2554_c0_g2_i1:8744-11998(+)